MQVEVGADPAPGIDLVDEAGSPGEDLVLFNRDVDPGDRPLETPACPDGPFTDGKSDPPGARESVDEPGPESEIIDESLPVGESRGFS